MVRYKSETEIEDRNEEDDICASQKDDSGRKTTELNVYDVEFWRHKVLLLVELGRRTSEIHVYDCVFLKR